MKGHTRYIQHYPVILNEIPHIPNCELQICTFLEQEIKENQPSEQRLDTSGNQEHTRKWKRNGLHFLYLFIYNIKKMLAHKWMASQVQSGFVSVTLCRTKWQWQTSRTKAANTWHWYLLRLCSISPLFIIIIHSVHKLRQSNDPLGPIFV